MSSTYDPGTAGGRTMPTAGQQPGTYQEYEAYEDYSYRDSAAAAGWLLILGGFWGFFIGLSAVVSTSYYKSLPAYSSLHNYTYHWNVSGWGWVHLILGVLAVAAGACVLLGQNWARWAGMVVAALSAIGSFMFLPFSPFGAILVIAIDVFIIWALATARRPSRA